MENENTFPLNTNIVKTTNRAHLVPRAGDGLMFCKDEDTALASYMRYRDEERDAAYEPIEEEFLTDIFKKGLVDGTLSEPVFIEGKRFGFFGCRINLGHWTSDGRFFLGEFFLYEME